MKATVQTTNPNEIEVEQKNLERFPAEGQCHWEINGIGIIPVTEDCEHYEKETNKNNKDKN